MDNASRTFKIQWKGRLSGPHSQEEICELLAKGKLSLIHNIQVDGRWISIADFLQKQNPTPRKSKIELKPTAPIDAQHSQEPSLDLPPRYIFPTTAPTATELNTEKLVLLGYILCGTTFVLPILATIPALLLARHIRSKNEKEAARQQTILCWIFTAFGLAFWTLLLFG